MPIVKLSCPGHAPIDPLWSQLLTAEQHAVGLQAVRVARVLEADETGRTTEWSLLLRGSPLNWTQREVAHPGQREVSVTLLRGDLKHLSGQWSVTDDGDHCMIHLTLDIDFGFPRVATVVDALLTETVTTVAQAIAVSAVRQARQQSAPADGEEERRLP